MGSRSLRYVMPKNKNKKGLSQITNSLLSPVTKGLQIVHKDKSVQLAFIPGFVPRYANS